MKTAQEIIEYMESLQNDEQRRILMGFFMFWLKIGKKVKKRGEANSTFLGCLGEANSTIRKGRLWVRI